MRRISLPPSPVDAFLNTTTIECTRFYFDDSARSSDVKQHPSFLQRSTSDLSRHLMEDGLAPYRPGSISSSTSNSSVAAALTDIKQHHPKTQHIQLVEGSARTWTCLDSVLAENLQMHLPSRVALLSKWCLLYSLDQHGCSLYTMYDCVDKHNGPCLLVIQTTDEEIFGAYISEPLHVSSRYYGSGECFLWRTSLHQLEIYPWTEQNDYLVFSDLESIAFGGGDGRIGLWLHGDLLHGHSDVCATFENPQLSEQPDFECLNIEIWGFCI